VECGLLRQTILLMDPRGKRCAPDASEAWPRDIVNLMANYAPPSTGVYFGGQKIGTVTNMSMRLPKKNNKILFQTLDLKAQPKRRVLPKKIIVKSAQWVRVSANGKRTAIYYAEDTFTGKPYHLTYYEIQRYYLGKSYKKYKIKGQRVTVPTYEITSNPTVFWKDIRIKKFNAFDRAKERMIAALSDQEKKAYDRALKERFKNPPAEEGWLDLPEEE